MSQLPSPHDLTALVRAAGAGLLTSYFSGYDGRWFESLAGGGDSEDTRDRITGDDLIGVEMLSVEFPARARWDLIDGPLGEYVNARLAEIPVDAEIGSPAAEALLAEPSAANEAFVRVRDSRYVTPLGERRLGYVIAGKLLARKRPGLIPVYDSRVRCQFGRPEKFWIPLHRRFRCDEGALRAALIAAREEAGVVDRTSVLRALDVILWMRHPECSGAKSCDGYGSVSLDCPQVTLTA